MSMPRAPQCRRSPTQWDSRAWKRPPRASSPSSTRKWRGPLPANAVARLMGSFPVIVPPAPGLLCAIGDLVADFRDEFAQTYIRLIAKASGGEVAGILDDLGARAQEWLEGEGIDESARRISYVTDMRYHRQGYEIPVAIDPDEVRTGGLADLEARLHAPHAPL